MDDAFQEDAFQNDAFQIEVAVNSASITGAGGVLVCGTASIRFSSQKPNLVSDWSFPSRQPIHGVVDIRLAPIQCHAVGRVSLPVYHGRVVARLPIQASLEWTITPTNVQSALTVGELVLTVSARGKVLPRNVRPTKAQTDQRIEDDLLNLHYLANLKDTA